MKISKSQIREILEEMWRLPATQRDTPSLLAAELVFETESGGQITIEEGEDSDELYVTAGGSRGYTVKVLRRGK